MAADTKPLTNPVVVKLDVRVFSPDCQAQVGAPVDPEFDYDPRTRHFCTSQFLETSTQDVTTTSLRILLTATFTSSCPHILEIALLNPRYS
jgi:hypothetical protein